MQTAVGGEALTHVLDGVLYGPVTPINAVCETVSWADAPVVQVFESITVDADKARDGLLELDDLWRYTIDTDAEGRYCYEAVLTVTVAGDDTPVAVRHEAGHASETTVASKERRGIDSVVADADRPANPVGLLAGGPIVLMGLGGVVHAIGRRGS